jgi:hypothetical protein
MDRLFKELEIVRDIPYAAGLEALVLLGRSNQHEMFMQSLCKLAEV